MCKSKIAVVIGMIGLMFLCMMLVATPPQTTAQRQDPTILARQAELAATAQIVRQTDDAAARERARIAAEAAAEASRIKALADAEATRIKAEADAQEKVARVQETAQAVQVTGTAIARATETAVARAYETETAVARATGTVIAQAQATQEAVAFAEGIRRQNEQVNIALRVMMTFGVFSLMVMGWLLFRTVRIKRSVTASEPESAQPIEPHLRPEDIEVELGGEQDLWAHLQAYGVAPAEVSQDG